MSTRVHQEIEIKLYDENIYFAKVRGTLSGVFITPYPNDEDTGKVELCLYTEDQAEKLVQAINRASAFIAYPELDG